MGHISGTTVRLQVLAVSGTDVLNVPTYTESWVDVENVLPGQPTDTEIVDGMTMYGKKAVYVLGIPKGDTHDWASGSLVEFFGEIFEIFGHSIQGIEENVPGPWNKKVMVAGYGTSANHS